MSFFATKKEKDDEDAGEDAATSSSSASSSSARDPSSSWFGVDMSSMQSALQAGIADFQEALNEQVEEAKVFVDDTSKVVNTVAESTKDFASKVAEEGVVVPDLFKLDEMQEEQEADDSDEDDDSESSDDDDDDDSVIDDNSAKATVTKDAGENESHRDDALQGKGDDRKQKKRSNKKKVQETGAKREGYDNFIEIPEQNKLFFSKEDADGSGGEAKRGKSMYRSDDADIDDAVDHGDNQEHGGNENFQTPAIKSRGNVKKLMLEPDTPWDWDTPQALKEQKGMPIETNDDNNRLDIEIEEDRQDEKERIEQGVEEVIAEEDRDIFDSVAASAGATDYNADEIDATIGELDEAALESSLDRQDSMYNKGGKDVENDVDKEILAEKKLSKKEKKERKKKKKKEKKKGNLNFFGFGSSNTTEADGVENTTSSVVVDSLVSLALMGELSVEDGTKKKDDDAGTAAESSTGAGLFSTPKPELSSLEKIGLSLASQLPQRLALWKDEKNKGPSFFDINKDDDEVDPILRQAELNRTNPGASSANWFKPRVKPLPNSPMPQSQSFVSSLTGYESDKSLGLMESQDSGQSGSFAAVQDGGWKKKIMNCCVFVIAVVQISCTRALPWIQAFIVVIFNMILTRSCERGRYQSVGDIEKMELQEQRKYKTRKFLIDAWEFITSAAGISVITCIFLIWSYLKFRRYGTDAGE